MGPGGTNDQLKILDYPSYQASFLIVLTSSGFEDEDLKLKIHLLSVEFDKSAAKVSEKEYS
ncbi:hypothetical protein PPACK8108_LOCUS6216 [Phakopsora pachyrhizi]|uniref:Uncharacterized protein n=1 Tax=Phakopsora pachyrhizi TaxID=170000 RepID=A0AAV0AUQ4_PHAPC|nr:hypothetical protein PPACK8108_LOCUS6216 [Phakopsora pachyrhizi]